MQYTEKNTEVLSVKISKGTAVVDCYHNGDNITFDKPESIHPDFQKSLEALTGTIKDVMYIKGEANVVPTGISRSELKEAEMVVISYKIETEHGKIVGTNTGQIPVEQADIQAEIKNIQHEAFQYLFQGKVAQQSIEFEEGGE